MGLDTRAAHWTARLQNPIARLWQALRTGRPGWTALAGVLVLALYLALVPFINRTWRATGDEPHYLLAAHSLVTDGDLDLTNNYDNFDYLDFYFSKDINRQIVTNRAGQQILNHQLALPLLITPAYALGGRWGVLVFQAILGGLLAMLTYRLALHVSRSEAAALLGTLLVMVSPPLLMYHYLVYPELAGALLATLVLYYAVTRNRPTPAAVVLVVASLLALPWLNRRFVPLALLLALLLLWAWRQPRYLNPGPYRLRRNWFDAGRPTWPAVLSLIAAGLSIGWLLWFNSQFSQPARIDILVPENVLALWHRLGRGIGWLVDQQRGLFIFGPVYILALWGLPWLLQNSWRERSRHWFVLLPFALSLGVTVVAGGYWVPWELGPRYLVVGLPALTSLLALAWRQHSRRLIWTGLAVTLAGLSVANTLVIIKNPEMPYKSSLPLYYGQRLNLPLTEWLPDLAGYARVYAADADPQKNRVIDDNGAPAWFAEAGRSQNLAQSPPLHQLPSGHYRLTWPLRVEPGLPPETKLMRISANFLGGGQLFNRVITAADLRDDGQYGALTYSFINTNADRWRTPLVFYAVTTGASGIRGRDIVFTPDPWFAWGLPYLYLALLSVAAGLAWYRTGRARRVGLAAAWLPLPRLPRAVGWGLLLALPLAGGGWLLYQNNQTTRTYDVSQLYHLAGRAITDPDALNGRAWLVDPQVDPPQKATHGPFDIYDAGHYRVTFRLKLPEPVDTQQEIARLQVNATANLDTLLTQSIRAGHFIRPNLYHDMVVTITNPRRQALSFEVHYLGIAPVIIDSVSIEKIDDSP